MDQAADVCQILKDVQILELDLTQLSVQQKILKGKRNSSVVKVQFIFSREAL